MITQQIGNQTYIFPVQSHVDNAQQVWNNLIRSHSSYFVSSPSDFQQRFENTLSSYPNIQFKRKI